MSQISYPNSSPYAVTPQLNWRLGRYQHRSLPPATTDERLTLTARYNNRPDRLSLDQYGTQQYWWVFMLRNMNVIRDPIFDMKAGITIYVPTLDRLKAVFG